jgi:hypothetical protein
MSKVKNKDTHDDITRKEECCIVEMVAEWLTSNGFDGLCTEDCGCTIEDLMPCEEPSVYQCLPGYKHAPSKMCECECDCDWHIGIEKQEQ